MGKYTIRFHERLVAELHREIPRALAIEVLQFLWAPAMSQVATWPQAARNAAYRRALTVLDVNATFSPQLGLVRVGFVPVSSSRYDHEGQWDGLLTNVESRDDRTILTAVIRSLDELLFFRGKPDIDIPESEYAHPPKADGGSATFSVTPELRAFGHGFGLLPQRNGKNVPAYTQGLRDEVLERLALLAATKLHRASTTGADRQAYYTRAVGDLQKTIVGAIRAGGPMIRPSPELLTPFEDDWVPTKIQLLRKALQQSLDLRMGQWTRDLLQLQGCINELKCVLEQDSELRNRARGNTP